MTEPERNAPCPCGSGRKFKKCCLNKSASPAARNSAHLMRLAEQHHHSGHLLEADALYRQIVNADPLNHEALHHLGLMARQLGDRQGALEWIDKAYRLHPTGTTLLSDAGMIHQEMGHFLAAAECYRRVIAIQPDYAAYTNLGIALYSLGRLAEAAECYQKALTLKPDLPEALNNLGLAYNELGRPAAALAPLRRAVILRPAYAEAHNNLGITLFELGQGQEALTCYQQAIKLKPDFAMAYNNLGNIYMNAIGKLDEAVTCYEKALTLQNEFAMARHNLGTALMNQGRIYEALSNFEHALTLNPNMLLAQDSRLFTLNYLADLTPDTVYQAHRDYGLRIEAPLKQYWQAYANIRAPERRLKIGYVSADLRLHSVAFFMEPILAHHDHDQVEVYCYYNYALRDEVTERLQAHADQWIYTREMTDEQLTARIRADGIDILVDLAGHTRENRLPVFAHRPAPVQVTYLGYVATTGLSAMDWRLSHLDTDPEGYEPYNSERLYRLPRSLWCYRPAQDLPAVAPTTPARTRGYPTFGSLNNIAKVSEATLAVWATLLERVPAARLIMAGVPAGTAQDGVKERFAARGVASDRLELHDKMSHQAFRELHQRIDLALDPFPHNGNTTTCESLYLGVPVITLIGDRFVGRFGYHLLKTLGLESLAARDENDYVRIAAELAGDLDRLEAARTGMRARLEASALRDEAGFTRDLEAAYRTMWRQWCAR